MYSKTDEIYRYYSLHENHASIIISFNELQGQSDFLPTYLVSKLVG